MRITKIKHQLNSIKMKNDESVNEYYHRIVKFWQQTKISKTDRIRQFIVILKFMFFTFLISKIFIQMRDLLNKTKIIENKKKEITYIHFNKFENKFNENRNNNESNFGNNSNNANKNNISGGFNKSNSNSLNMKFISCNIKSEEWTGKWYDFEARSKKMNDDEKLKLTKQKKC